MDFSTLSEVKNIAAFRRKRPEMFQFLLYFCIGASAALVDLSIFVILFNFFEVSKYVATLISTSFAAVYAFGMNAHFNFKVSTHLFKRFLSYFSVNLVGLGISFLLLYVFAQKLGINANIVKALSLPVIFVVQFLLNRFITFHKNFSHSTK